MLEKNNKVIELQGRRGYNHKNKEVCKTGLRKGRAIVSAQARSHSVKNVAVL